MLAGQTEAAYIVFSLRHGEEAEMKILFALCIAGLVAPAASAQWVNSPIPNTPAITSPLGLNSDSAFRFDGTPTMQRQKMRESLALRAEAQQLEQKDGGTLSPEHVAYVRKRVREIMGSSAD